MCATPHGCHAFGENMSKHSQPFRSRCREAFAWMICCASWRSFWPKACSALPYTLSAARTTKSGFKAPRAGERAGRTCTTSLPSSSSREPRAPGEWSCLRHLALSSFDSEPRWPQRAACCSLREGLLYSCEYPRLATAKNHSVSVCVALTLTS